MLTDNELWLLSFYRTSEISGSLFFGRLARSASSGQLQADLTRHFSDEARHAWYWNECIQSLGASPQRVTEAYQDRYIEAAGLPANMMDVLAITNAFERRVIGQYARHSKADGILPEVRDTLKKIMSEEVWHIQWVSEALERMKPEYGEDAVAAAVRRCVEADREVYRKTMQEHQERLAHLLEGGKHG